MLPAWFVLFSVAIRLASGGQYAWGVLRGKARPNPVTWFLWGLTAMIAFLAQLQSGPTAQALVTFVLGLSPLVIFAIAMSKGHGRGHFTPFTISCAAIAVIGIVLWRVTANPELAISFAIAADICASLPTLRKAYHDPESEYAFPYLLSVVSMAITLGTITDWSFTVYAFPLYMLCINVALYGVARFRVRRMVRRLVAHHA